MAAALMLRKEGSISTKRVQGRDGRSVAIRRLTKRSTNDGNVLRADQLAIVRAALTLWDEEMGSAPEAVYQHYLHSKDQGAAITAEDIATTRAYFNQVNLKFGLVDRQQGVLVSKQLCENSGELDCQPKQQVASVLIG